MTKKAPTTMTGQEALPTEREQQISRRFLAWEATKEQLQELRKEHAGFMAVALAGLRASMEEGIPVGEPARALAKLHRIEDAWQTLEEAKQARADAIKSAKEDVSAAETRLREAMENIHQLSLFAEGDE
jgi:hypothetical protein